jgi:hypothetical protein
MRTPRSRPHSTTSPTATLPPAASLAPNSDNSAKDRFVTSLTCLGVGVAVASFLQSAVGWLPALLIAAAIVVALYVAIKAVPALQIRATRLRVKIRTNRSWRLAAIGVASLVIIGAGLAAWDLSIPTPPITGAITYPRNDAIIHLNHEFFPIGGTVENLPAGFRLLLFLQWTNDNRYLGGNPYIVVKNGHWSGPKLLPVGARHPFVAWLVAQGPKTINFMNSPRGQQLWSPSGFPSLTIASDSIVLDHIQLNVS